MYKLPNYAGVESREHQHDDIKKTRMLAINVSIPNL